MPTLCLPAGSVQLRGPLGVGPGQATLWTGSVQNATYEPRVWGSALCCPHLATPRTSQTSAVVCSPLPTPKKI